MACTNGLIGSWVYPGNGTRHTLSSDECTRARSARTVPFTIRHPLRRVLLSSRACGGQRALAGQRRCPSRRHRECFGASLPPHQPGLGVCAGSDPSSPVSGGQQEKAAHWPAQRSQHEPRMRPRPPRAERVQRRSDDGSIGGRPAAALRRRDFGAPPAAGATGSGLPRSEPACRGECSPVARSARQPARWRPRGELGWVRGSAAGLGA